MHSAIEFQPEAVAVKPNVSRVDALGAWCLASLRDSAVQRISAAIQLAIQLAILAVNPSARVATR